MMCKHLINLLPIALASVFTAHAATLEWTGNGDGISLFQETNWQMQGGGAVSGNPLAPNVTITDALVFTGTAPAVSSELRLASSLAINGGSLTMVNGGGMKGGTVSISANGTLNTDWANSTAITLTHGNLNIRGGGAPLNASTIACSGNQWQINFTNETPVAVQSEHLSKITIGGQPAVVGSNCSLSAQGGSGSRLEPVSDTDNDGLSDTWEQQYFGNLAATATGDPDGDLLSNLTEQTRGTHPKRKDTDNDGFDDKAETGTGTWVSTTDTGTNATLADTDKDGLPDGVETNTGTFVSGTDTGTNPHSFNTDGDRIGDGAEVARGNDPTNASNQPDLPNIVFIMADDLGYNHLSSYGQQRLTTPHIDSLGAQGIRFTNAYAGCTVCGPSRSSLMTGIHSGHIPYKVNNAYVDLTNRTKTIAEVFKESGYMTAAFGKWGNGGLGSGQTPTERGFDYFLGMHDHGHGHRHFPHYLMENGVRKNTGNTTDSSGNTSTNPASRVQHTHDAFTDGAIQFIEDNKDHAFFCYLAFTLPHTEIIATDVVLNTPEFAPANWPEAYTANTSIHISQSQPRRHYGAELRMIDNSVGAIVAKLAELNLTDNTLVIFTSDNGGQLKSTWGSAPSIHFNANGILRGGKTYSYEGGLRVPALAKWPGKIPFGTVSDHPWYFADVMPTFTEILGIKPPSYTDGISIFPTLKGDAANQKKHRYLYWAHLTSSQLDHAVRAGKWKAVKRGGNAIELYNLETDPSETSNVASSNTAIVQEMQRIITREYVPDFTGIQPSSNSPVYPNHPQP